MKPLRFLASSRLRAQGSGVSKAWKALSRFSTSRETKQRLRTGQNVSKTLRTWPRNPRKPIKKARKRGKKVENPPKSTKISRNQRPPTATTSSPWSLESCRKYRSCTLGTSVSSTKVVDSDQSKKSSKLTCGAQKQSKICQKW